jgi:superfamily II DNA or RNA helicase
MRPYQKAAVEALLFDGLGRGMIEIPTAGGKSFIVSNFIWNLLKHVDSRLKILILVPNVQLVEQFYGDMLEYGFQKGQLAKFEGGMSRRQQKENDVSTAKVIIANRQYMFKNEKRLPPVDVLVCDEIHTCLAESTTAMIQRLPARIRVGCSGTIPQDRYQRNQLVGMFGKVVYREEITDLQDEGFITRLRITSVDVFDRQVDSDRSILFHVNSTRKYVADDPDGCDIRFDDAVKAEHEYVAKWYREIYSPVLEVVAGLKGNTLVLFDKLDIGRSLYELFRERHPGIVSFYNDGSTKVKDREDVRSGLE